MTIAALLLSPILCALLVTVPADAEYKSMFADDSRLPEGWNWLEEPFVGRNCYSACRELHPALGIHVAGITVSDLAYMSYPAQYDCRCIIIKEGKGVCKTEGGKSVTVCTVEEEILQLREEQEANEAKERKLEAIRKEL